jgi:hypothetical protein
MIKMLRPSRMLAATAIALWLALGIGTLANDSAAAKPVPRGRTSLHYECRRVQNEANNLLDEYKRDSTSAERRDEILAELRAIGSYWRAAGCQAAFGDIVGLQIVEPDRPDSDRGAVATDGNQEAVIANTAEAASAGIVPVSTDGRQNTAGCDQGGNPVAPVAGAGPDDPIAR